MPYFIFVLALVLSGCDSPRNHRVTEPEAQFQKHSFNFTGLNLSVRTDWLEGPFGDVHTPSTLMVYVYNAEGKLQSLPAGWELGFYATMPSMGHPLDRPGYFEEISTGVYLNSSITFNMAGDWRMELSIADENFSSQGKVLWDQFF